MRTTGERTVRCETEDLVIPGYYFPIGAKHIPYRAIREVRQVALGAFRGRLRLWGTANLRYWAARDFRRPGKSLGFVVDTGRWIRPFVTPDDPAAFAAALTEHGVSVTDGGRAPLM